MNSFAAPRALKSETLSIEDLLGRVRKGQLRMPGFQRPLVWSSEDVRLLLDSVYNGYPIGMLLLWEREAPAEQIRWGHWLQDVAAHGRAWWIVDGQHRIATFVLAMSRPAPGVWGVDPRFTWYWDLRKHEFFQPQGRAEVPAHWLPLYCVDDMVSLIRWGEKLLQADGTEAEVEEARQWARHMANFKLLAYVTEAAHEGEVRRIFDRTNSSGRSLNADDVFHGLYGGPGQSLALAAEAMSDMQFGGFDRQLVMQALLAIDGQNITNLKAAVHQLSQQRAIELQAPTVTAIRRTVEFLREDCGFPSICLVPYELSIIVLARFFHLFPDPSPRSRILLRRWLWRGSVTGSHAKGLRTGVRQSVRAVVAGEQEQSVQRLLALTPFRDPTPSDTTFRPSSVDTKIDLLALASWRPRQLNTGHPLVLPDLLVAGVRAATSAQLATGRSAGEFLHTAANRILHEAVGSGPHENPKAESTIALLRNQRPEILASHGLTAEDIEDLSGPQAAQALARRAQRIAETRARLVASQCEWQRSDRPSLDWLMGRDAEAA